eukprot:125343_1
MGGVCSRDEPYTVKLSHFEVLQIISSSKYTKVLLVRDRESDSILVMKEFDKLQAIEDQSVFRTIWIERRLSKLFNHPCVLPLYHAFQDEGSCYLLTPFKCGGNLAKLIMSEVHISIDQCRIYAAEIVLGLEHIHQCHVVYRGLTLDNILLDEHGHVYLSDFKLSERLRMSRRKLKLVGKTGTRPYMAPEQFERKEYNYSVDFWAFGIVLCELLTGKKPFINPMDCVRCEPKLHEIKDPATFSLISGLLRRKPANRIGSKGAGFVDLKKHAFFSTIDWEKIENREIEPDYSPPKYTYRSERASDMFDQINPTTDHSGILRKKSIRKMFRNFEYNVGLPLKPPQDRETYAAIKNTEFSITLSRATTQA